MLLLQTHFIKCALRGPLKNIWVLDFFSCPLLSEAHCQSGAVFTLLDLARESKHFSLGKQEAGGIMFPWYRTSIQGIAILF